MKDYLTVVEFAAAAGITKQAVYKRIKQDLAPYVKSKTEKRLYQKKRLNYLKKKNQQKPHKAQQKPHLCYWTE